MECITSFKVFIEATTTTLSNEAHIHDGCEKSKAISTFYPQTYVSRLMYHFKMYTSQRKHLLIIVLWVSTALAICLNVTSIFKAMGLHLIFLLS